jgi:hypothetical protein
MAMNYWDTLETAATAKRFYRAFLYGKAGTGKTLFLASCPSPFIVNTDDGLETLDSRGIVLPRLTITLKHIMDGMKVYQELTNMAADIATKRGKWATDFAHIQTIGFDSLSTLAQLLLWDYMRNEHGNRRPDQVKAEFEDYGAVRSRLDTLMRLYASLDMHIVATAGVKAEDDDTSTQQILPDILGSYRGIVTHAFDTAVFMRKVLRGRTVCWVGETQSATADTKVRTDGVPSVVDSPTFDSVFITKTESTGLEPDKPVEHPVVQNARRGARG